MSNTFLTTDQLAERTQYDPRIIREQLKDSAMREGVHYIRPFGRRKILYIWEAIERDMFVASSNAFGIPMTNGGVCNG